MRPLNEETQMARLDPAASKLKYRLERLMLTPGIGAWLRTGLPLALLFGAVGWWVSVEANRAAVALMLTEMRATIESRPEFQVRLMAIDGAGPDVAADIREILPVDFPVSSFDLDLDAMQGRVVALDAVESADLRIRQGGVLQIAVRERVPAVLWRHDDGLTLLDAGGVRVGPAASRRQFAALPVIAGEGAERAVAQALDLLAVTGPLQDRLRGFERMGARRWDVVLDRGQRILLPEERPVEALERVIGLHQAPAVRLLDRDVTRVDLRLPQRPTVRLSADAVEALRAFREIETSGGQTR